MSMPNREYITELAREVRERFPGKTQWLYTGYEWEDIKDLPAMEYLDVVVDGKFESGQKDASLHWKGSSNQKVIDVQGSLRARRTALHDT